MCLHSLLSKSKEKEIIYKYEVARLIGKYNMFDDRARKLSGLNKNQYLYAIKNYTYLIKKYPNTKERAIRYINSIQKKNNYIKKKIDIARNDKRIHSRSLNNH